ncbi:MAG: IS110 family transposase [bacterium]|nr:IS110 family transposase [bacterium]
MKKVPPRIYGCDLGDRKSHMCALGGTGEVLGRSTVATTKNGFTRFFGGERAVRVVIEAGTHSPWVSALLEDLGHEVIVANPRNVRLISQNKSKSDRVDAELLARLARVDVKLLSPIQHRGARAREDLAMVRARSELVETRTKLINHVRGSMKSQGERLPSCTADVFARKGEDLVPEAMEVALGPVLKVIEAVTVEIKALDKKIEKDLPERYPEVVALRQVHGVGPLTALTFMLTLGDPTRFKKSRQVGAYLGLRPGRSQSGKADPELHITKAGDRYLRSLLVNCAQYILGPFGKDSDLRRWGLELAARGQKNAKKRAVVAVARRLAVLLHRLWVTGEVYEPLGYARRSKAA